MSIKREIARRRSFAIISHPDAGKTTLTEKFLLYGGALHLAGSVTARKTQRATTSDWMELEKKRGISISSTVLQFDYRDFVINLLDTPGHRDFSEDTYRVLTAVDAVIMVIDGAKGIESQTRKLFEICRKREIPILTFVNKLDRPSKEPLSLLDEIGSVLGIETYAVNWPLGSGTGFRGLFDRLSRKVHLFERVQGGAYIAPVAVRDLSDPQVKDRLSTEIFEVTLEELKILDGAGAEFDREKVSGGKLTPVLFGSASNNFGIQLLLDSFLDYAPAPKARNSAAGIIQPENEAFSGFVFKIQANMDPKHRDRLAFIRICSGQFIRDMSVIHTRTQRKLRLASSHKLFGQERETVDEAYAGDIIGVIGHTDLRIGDTVTTDPSIVYNEIPRFAPECFAYLHNTHTSKLKRFRSGLSQLLQEGVVQLLHTRDATDRSPLLAAVGPLQFEVAQYRLESEYGAESRIETASWERIRWLPEGASSEIASSLPNGSTVAKDSNGHDVILFHSPWAENFFRSKNPTVPLSAEPLV